MKPPPLKLSVLQALLDDGENSTDDVTTLCRTVVELHDIFEDPTQDQDLLTSFAIVAVEIISSKGYSLNRANVFIAWKAGKILMKFMMARYQSYFIFRLRNSKNMCKRISLRQLFST